jgi:rhodanese-related sulfurtransferase
MNNVIIDIREEHELKEKYLNTNNSDIVLLNIPSRNIIFNKKFIENLSLKNKIYLVCKSGNRSGKIKELYFKNNKNINSLEGGIENIINLNLDIDIRKGNNNFGMNQYMQLIFITIFIIYFYFNKFSNRYKINFNNINIIYFIYLLSNIYKILYNR